MVKENPTRLKIAGPIDPDNGFPLWFEDESGLRLELGINRDFLNPDPLLPAIGDLQKPAESLSFPGNFPDESFYFLAEAELQVGGNGRAGRARVILALEAAFGGTGAPQAGLNVVFARIRVRMDDLIPGLEYKVIHPYGEIDGELMKADDRGRVFYTQDLGIVEGDGTAVLRTGQVAPFLQGATAVLDGYIGDGVTPQRVTGSPIPFNTNLVTIEWSPINPITNLPDPQRVSTDLFTVQGRKAKRVGAWLDSATYEALSDGSFLLTVQARSDAGKDLRLVGTGVHFKLDSEGEFYTGLAQVASLPTDARLVNVSDKPPTSYPIKDFTDRVIVESAIYDRTAGTLTIKAQSFDPSAVLTLSQFNNLPLTSNPQEIDRVAVPTEIIVKSDKGGEDRQWVEVTRTTFSDNGSVKAIAAPPTVAFAEEEVTLDGSDSLDTTSFTWTQTAGTNTPPTGANTAKLTFTPPAAGDYTFNLKVGGNGGSTDNTDITVAVKPKRGIDILSGIRAEYRTATGQLRVSGTVSQVPNVVTVKFNNKVIGRAAADITGAWSVREVLLKPDTDPVPVQGDRVQVNSNRSIKDADENKANIRIK
jgi:hypothetical protein